MISISGQSPVEGEKRVDLDSLIEFSLIDDGSGIDLSSLIVEISEVRAVDGVEFKNGFDGVYSNISLESYGASVIIDKETPFREDETVNDGKTRVCWFNLCRLRGDFDLLWRLKR